MYHWIRSCSVEPLSIYSFTPHGSKNIVDLRPFSNQDTNAIAPGVVCHDQEPLDYSRTQNVDIFAMWLDKRKHNPEFAEEDNWIHASVSRFRGLNFYSKLRIESGISIFDRYILLHSEKNSQDVEKFSQTAEPVYYWCHGIIARDWYRFAEHDTRLQQNVDIKKTFLVYCRAWTGTRQYRLKFLELLIEKKLIESCSISVLHQDQEFELGSYVCDDSAFWSNNTSQLTNIPNNRHLPDSSADYCVDDFVSTDISVVLETVAADTKIHLTEKTLRPIACGHPFVLVAGPGSLEYLKFYGFKTFSPWIDESYDQEQDIVLRMQMIVEEMQRIKNLPTVEKQHALAEMKKISNYNKSHFFSKTFFNKIHTELVENLTTAVDRVKVTRGKHYLATRAGINQHRSVSLDKSNRGLSRKYEIAKTLRTLRKDPTTSIKQIISQFPNNFFNV